MASRQPWLRMADGLENELAQLQEEGRVVPGELTREIEETLKMPEGREKNERAVTLFERGQALPYAGGVNPEPDDLAGIQALAKGNPAPAAYDRETLYDHVYGAWLGRCAGCLLGKPVEGWRTPQLHAYLRATDNFPLKRYIRGDATEEQKARARFAPGSDPFARGRAFIERVDCMPEDDDTNYTVIGLKLLEDYGRGFTPEDAAENWLKNLPILHCCTAERVAYRNLVMSVAPPASASYCNGYREWIGAQIRADFFGYVNPGDPRAAADMAWRDAAISHVKNGIYGEMWVAAMLAQAAVTRDIRAIISAGMNEIPAGSRLYAALEDVMRWHEAGLDWEEAVEKISARWDEFNGHHWCHTVSNAQLVAAALLWGDGDLGKTICLGVMPGFDTDCNGATAGSVVGMMAGAKALPAEWIDPLNDTLVSGVDGFGRVRVSDLARRTVDLIR